MKLWRRITTWDMNLNEGDKCWVGGETFYILDKKDSNLIIVKTDRIFLGKLQYRLYLSWRIVGKTLSQLCSIWRIT